MIKLEAAMGSVASLHPIYTVRWQDIPCKDYLTHSVPIGTHACTSSYINICFALKHKYILLHRNRQGGEHYESMNDLVMLQREEIKLLCHTCCIFVIDKCV